MKKEKEVVNNVTMVTMTDEKFQEYLNDVVQRVLQMALPDRLLTMKEAKSYLNTTSNRCIENLVKEGEFKRYAVGKTWRFKRSELEDYVNRTASY